jgi:tetratricopeptide (TPR) repeat protein
MGPQSNLTPAKQPLEPPDTHFLSAAVGWLGLGNLTEAKSELAQISEPNQHHPDVLELRWDIASTEKNWQQALEIARELLQAAPERCSGWWRQAYALRRVPDGTIKKAWDALLPAFDKFPEESIISYNLSCYACQMGQLDAARVWFKRAVVIGGKQHIKAQGLADSDLEPLWEEIKQL